MSGPNRIDPTPVRLSNTQTVDRQTPKTDFGDRVKVGLDTTAGAVAHGAQVAAPFVPGGAIVSAAVSSVSTMSNAQTPGAGPAVASAYSSQLANPGTTGVYTPSASTPVPGGNTGTAGSITGGTWDGQLAQMQSDNMKLMQVQIAMQRENQVFSTVSNVLKTRHDTVKNTIANVR